jgi:hypothetical protein|tara:strand:- start:125 stop:346 length:222 start_codon:yes stop_codon:yes gene_type:complete
MSKKQKENSAQKITINDTEYLVSDLTEQQIVMVNHVQDLDRKLSSAQFNIDQLNVGRNSFMTMLTDALKEKEE